MVKMSHILLVLATASMSPLAAEGNGSSLEFGLKGIFIDSHSINAHCSNGLPGLFPAYYHGVSFSSSILSFGWGDLFMGAEVYGMIEGNAHNEYYNSTIGGFTPSLRIRPMPFLELGAQIPWYCGISNLCNGPGEVYMTAVNALDPGIETSLLLWGFRLSGTVSWLQPITNDGLLWMKPHGFAFSIMLGKDFWGPHRHYTLDPRLINP